MSKILLVEDDLPLSTGLCFELDTSGYLTVAAYHCQKALKLVKTDHFDLAILDVNLPDGDGFDFCRAVKSERDIPIIFLTARDMDQDEMRGFDCGADDYITKPFKMPILHRRILAAFRKSGAKEEHTGYDDGYLKIDFDKLTAVRGEETLSMTPTEYKILRLLIANSDKVMTKCVLLEKIWDNSGNFVDEHAVAVNINRLRKKIEDTGHEYIKTLYGMGYQWKGRNKA